MKKLFLLLFLLAFFRNSMAEQPYSVKDGNRVLVDHLSVLVFQKEYKNINVGLDKKIVIAGVDIPNTEEFVNTMQSFLGKPLSLNLLNQIKLAVIDYFRDGGYPLVGVKIPANQDITEGKVNFVISRARLGSLEVEGARYFSKQRLKDQIRTKKGELIQTNTMLEDLEWLNDNPFRNVSLLYKSGKTIRETDVILDVQDAFPARVYAGYENTGNNVAGPSRYLVGFNLGNVFKLDQQLNFQFITAPDTKKWWGMAGNYIIPLPWKNIFKVFGTYSQTRSDVDAFSNLTGKGWYLGFRYEIPLPIYKKLSHDIIIGYDFKTTNNFLTYSKNLIFNENIDISQFLLKYQGSVDDKYGISSFELTLFVSPGDMTKNNRSKNFQIERVGAKSNYFYFEFDFERITKLPHNFSWVVNFFGQLSSGKLIPSEELSLGGYLTIRGYQENAVIGDHGFLLKNEIRLPPYKFTKKKLVNVLQFLAFIDFGSVTDTDNKVLAKNSLTLLSIGPGIRYSINNNLSARVDWGYQLKPVHGRMFDKGRDSRWHIGINVAY